jgi:TetR/AcrR family transcriptional regulator
MKPAVRKVSPVSPPSRGEETRAAILAAAGRVFAEAGLAGARTDAIAVAAGVNKALLYYYFRSKDRLYAAVLEDQFREFNEQAVAALTAAGPACAVLLHYVNLHFDLASQRRRFAPLHQQFMMLRGQSMESLVRRHFLPRIQALARLLERGMREGEFRPADIRHTAVSLTALIVFYFAAAPMVKLLGPADAYSEADLKRRKQQVLDFIRYGLFVHPEAPLS